MSAIAKRLMMVTCQFALAIICAAIAPESAGQQSPSATIGKGKITGRVVNKASNMGISNVCLNITRQGGSADNRREIYSDSSGKFEVSDLEASTYTVSLGRGSQKRFLPEGDLAGLAFPAFLEPMILAEGQSCHCQIELEPAVTISGRIIDSAGAPLKLGITVDSGVCGSAMSGEGGEFEISGVEPGKGRFLSLMSFKDYGYFRMVELKREQMQAGQEVRLADIIMPSPRPRNVVVRFNFDGDADWIVMTKHYSTTHSLLEVQRENDSFQALVYGETEEKKLLLPPGKYTIKEYEFPAYRSVVPITFDGIARSCPSGFEVPEEGIVEVKIVLKQIKD